MLRRVLLTGKRAIYVAPYVALAEEKVQQFKAVFSSLDSQVRGEPPVRVGGFFGSKTIDALGRTQVCVCTVDKANTLLSKFVLESRVGGCLLKSCAGSPAPFACARMLSLAGPAPLHPPPAPTPCAPPPARRRMCPPSHVPLPSLWAVAPDDRCSYAQGTSV
jgi:hypothetical protein